MTRRLLLLFGVPTFLLFCWNLYATLQHRDTLRVTFLDVGQGDACVIQTPSDKTILIDSGGVGQEKDEDAGRRVVAPFLRHEGIGHIDAILLTHPHADHIGGATTLLSRFGTTLLMDNGEQTNSSIVTRYQTVAHEKHLLYRAGRRGQKMDCGDGVTLEILAPTEAEASQPAETNGAANNASLIVRVKYGRTAFLLTGDAESMEEEELVQSNLPIDADLLKAGHHGSRTSSTPDLLQHAHPRMAIISVGAHNLYGHPNKEVLDRLEQNHISIFRTDQHGAILCTSNGVTIQVRTMK